MTDTSTGPLVPDPRGAERVESSSRVRILITGSRDWTDTETIRRALSEAWHALGRPADAVLVHGACHLGGADRIAADIWRSWGYLEEPHVAEMGPGGHRLGPKRNAEMVALGATICLAFPLPQSRGTRNCMRLAKEAGIPVRVYRTDSGVS